MNDLITQILSKSEREHRIKCPFIRGTRELYSGEGNDMVVRETWEVGVHLHQKGYQGGYCDAIADGEGEMVLTEVGRYKPGRYPERVFYIRQFIDPDGRYFGKRGLRVCIATKFKRLCTPWKTFGDDETYTVKATTNLQQVKQILGEK